MEDLLGEVAGSNESDIRERRKTKRKRIALRPARSPHVTTESASPPGRRGVIPRLAKRAEGTPAGALASLNDKVDQAPARDSSPSPRARDDYSGRVRTGLVRNHSTSSRPGSAPSPHHRRRLRIATTTSPPHHVGFSQIAGIDEAGAAPWPVRYRHGRHLPQRFPHRG